MKPDIVYPVISFWSKVMDACDDEGTLYGLSAREYMRWRRLALVLDVIDSAGLGYAMTEPVPHQPSHAMGIFSWLLNERLSVEFTNIKELGPIPLDEFKTRVIANMKEDSELYDADGNLYRRIADVTKARDHKAVIEVFRAFM